MQFETITIGEFSYVVDNEGGVLYTDEAGESHFVEIEVIS